MRHLFLILVLSTVIFSCNKDKKEDPAPIYVPKYATVRIELTAEKSTAPSNFTSNLDVYINGITTNKTTYTSLSNKSNSIVQEYTHVQDNKRISTWGKSSICDVPLSIKVYYDGSLVNSSNSNSTCSTELSFGVDLPNHGK